MGGKEIPGWARRGMFTGLLAAAMLVAACSKPSSQASYSPSFIAPPAQVKVAEYSFGVSPTSNFRSMYEAFQPIIEHINGGLSDAKLVLEVSRGLDEHQQKLRARHFAFAFSNPYHSVRAAEGGAYRIVAKLGDDAAFYGVWAVRRDSGIASLSDLKGKTVSFPPTSALAGTMMTQLQLQQAGIDPRRDIHASYVGSHHASIMTVYSKGAAAGATWPLAWATFQHLHPAEASELEVRFPTEPLVNMGIVARRDVPPALVRRVAELMADMHKTEKGRALLAQVPSTRFELAGDAQYQAVHEFIVKYKLAFDSLPE